MTTKLNADKLDEMALRARIAEIATKLTWLKPHEAACYMNIGESTLRRFLAEGAIPSSKDNGHVRIARADIDAYWVQRKRGTGNRVRSASKNESEPDRPGSQSVS